jgi:hypothetical protein
LDLDGVVADGDVARPELYSQGGLVVGLEASLGEAEEEAGLADACVLGGVLESPMMMNLNMKS